MNKTNLITNSLITLGLEESEGKGKGRYFQSKFIEAGIAHYDELGDILITKETLDKFIHTMVGCPVIINHKDVTDKNVDKLRVGVISKVWFNETDGWYYCEGILTDSQAIDLIKNQGWNVSCSYNFVSDNQKKTYHGKEIDMEFIDGEFLHLAIVENPRYEGANIVVNSKKDDGYWFKTDKNVAVYVEEGQTKKEALENRFNNKYDFLKFNENEKYEDKIIRLSNSKEFTIGCDIDINEELKKEIENITNNICFPDRIKGIYITSKPLSDISNLDAFGVNYKVDKNNDVIVLNGVIFGDDKKIKEHLKWHWIADSEVPVKEYIINHEVGHSIYNKYKKSIDVELKILLSQYRKDNNNIISEYAKKDAKEFFSEAYAWYKTNKNNNKYVNKVIGLIKNSTDEKENIPMAVLDELKSFILSVVNNEEDKKEKKETVETEKEVENEDEEKEEEKAENKCKNSKKSAKNEEEDEKEDEAENEDDEELEEKEEVIKNEDDEDDEKAENEDDEEEKEVENKKVKNSISNMKRIVSGEGTKMQKESLYTSQAERLELGNEY